MAAKDPRPIWKEELRQLREKEALLLTKITVADEIFGSEAEPTIITHRIDNNWISLSDSIKAVVRDYGKSGGLTINEIIARLHEYGFQKKVNRGTVYKLATRFKEKEFFKGGTKEGQTTFAPGQL